ncbi:MAG: response regulator transcription factor [Planctomycetes bacterium]|nr:response regulator transcription factor [Planctomycetota bacterium]
MTVFVVDDDPAVLDSLRALLESAGWQVQTFVSAADFLTHYQPGQPGCLIVDVRMPGMSGLELLDHLREREIKLPTIVLTGHGDLRLGVDAIKAGAVNVLEKPIRPSEILSTIEEALRSVPLVEAAGGDDFRRRLQDFTPGEMAVLRGIVLGRSNPVIAQELDLSLRTVQFRRAAIWKKLGVGSKRELMDQVFAAGWSPSEAESGEA